VISFRVYGDPKGQPRPRATVRKSGKASVYDAGTAEGWKFAIALAAREHKPSRPLMGPLSVCIDFYFKRPQRLCRKKDCRSRFRHIVKPDRDNLDKGCLDTLTKCGFWFDDAQVCAGSIEKWWCALKGDEEELAAGAMIVITELSDT